MIVGRERDQVGKGETEKEKKKKSPICNDSPLCRLQVNEG